MKQFDFDNPPTKDETEQMTFSECLTVALVIVNKYKYKTEELLREEHEAQQIINGIRGK